MIQPFLMFFASLETIAKQAETSQPSAKTVFIETWKPACGMSLRLRHPVAQDLFSRTLYVS